MQGFQSSKTVPSSSVDFGLQWRSSLWNTATTFIDNGQLTMMQCPEDMIRSSCRFLENERRTTEKQANEILSCFELHESLSSWCCCRTGLPDTVNNNAVLTLQKDRNSSCSLAFGRLSRLLVVFHHAGVNRRLCIAVFRAVVRQRRHVASGPHSAAFGAYHSGKVDLTGGRG